MHILFFGLVKRPSKRKRTVQPAPKSFRSSGSRRPGFAILLVDASREPQARTRETACLSLRQQLEVLLHLLGPTVLRGGWNLDMPLLPHYPRRIHSPPSLDIHYKQGLLGLSNFRSLFFPLIEGESPNPRGCPISETGLRRSGCRPSLSSRPGQSILSCLGGQPLRPAD